MKSIITVLVMLIFSNGMSFAQLKKQENNCGFIGMAGFGLSMPGLKKVFPPQADILGASFYFTAGYLFNNNMATSIRVNYSTFTDYVFRSDRQALIGSFNSLSIESDFLAGFFNKKKSTNIYAIVGLGFNSLSNGKQGEININKGETNIGLSVGAGFNLKLYKSLGLCWEIQYNALLYNESLNGYLYISMLSLSYVP
jgi:hypothetical protein